jgi:excisionase family DNA binding protein
MQTEIQDALIGIRQLSERLGLSRRTIARILARGELPSLRIGRRRLIRLADLRHWLAGLEVETPDANVSNIRRQLTVK